MITLQFSGNATTGQVKEITHGGRRYLVSPVVALREGILNDTYVSAAEFSKFASSWQGRPVPISHPRADGLPTSANTPDIWANDVLGHLWNVAVDGGALKGEIWIDLDKAQTMGERALSILNRLRQGDPMEVSTGYFCEMEATAGSYNGAAYGGIARNIRPDHLALLPDEVGACSWADGCGTPRVNSDCGQGTADCGPEKSALLVRSPQSAVVPERNNMDESTLIQRFLGWLKNSQSEIFSSTSIEEGTVSLNTDLDGLVAGQNALDTNVTVVSPPTPGGLATNLIEEENLSMGKEQLIAGLVANSKCKFSKDKLQTWAEGDLQVLQDSLGEEISIAPATPEPEAPLAIPRPETALTLPPELTTWMAGIESMIKGLTANSDREKAELVAAIVANAHGAWSEADLMRHDLPKLQTVYSSYMPRDYSLSGGTLRVNGPEEETMLMPWPDEFKKLGV